MSKEVDRLADFDEWLARADHEAKVAWEAAQAALPFDEPDRTGNCSSPMTVDITDLEPEEIRLVTMRALLDFLWAAGPCLLRAAERLYHVTYNVSPELVWYMNQTRLGRQLNQGRATFQAADKRLWEEYLGERGFLGTRAPGKKGDAARKTYSEGKKGNNCRRGGRKAKRKKTNLKKGKLDS
jgi:hypothetical protein